MHKRISRHEVTVHALTSRLWRVVTSSEYTEQFFFDGQYISEWQHGSPIFSAADTGESPGIQKGIVEDVVPGISIQFSLFEPGRFSTDPVLFTYELVPDQGGIMLILTAEAVFTSDQLHKLMDEQCRLMLQKIKWLAEYVNPTEKN